MAKKYSSIPETLEHIKHIRKALMLICEELKFRGLNHDSSKTKDPEVSYFDKYTPELKKLTYGSSEYNESLESLKPALEHHYKNNRHHPEYFDEGIEGMNLIDVLEMFCDWYAASKRTKDGDIRRSIDVSCDRFNIGLQLKKILKNSIDLIEKPENHDTSVKNNYLSLCTNCNGDGCFICNYTGATKD